MKLKVISREGAKRDVVRIYQRLTREAGRRTGERFLAAVNQAFVRLSKSPLIGTRYETDHPSLAELRCLSLSARFKNYLVFYICPAGQIDVVRILHGAQDRDAILPESLEDEDVNDPAE